MNPIWILRLGPRSRKIMLETLLRCVVILSTCVLFSICLAKKFWDLVEICPSLSLFVKFLYAYELFIWAIKNSLFWNPQSSNEFSLCLFVTLSSLLNCIIILLLTVSNGYANVSAKSNIHYDHSTSTIR